MFIKDPFPNGFVMDALKATVGYSFCKCFIHLFVIEGGTKSTLFMTKTRCL